MEKYKVSHDKLESKLALPFDEKIQHFIKVFTEFFFEYNGHVYLSFSGGKDSQVGCDIIDRLWSGEFSNYLPDVIHQHLLTFDKPPRVFANTGLEFPEIVEHAKKFDNTVVLKPKMGFLKVIKEIGVAVGPKKISMQIRRTKEYLKNPSPSNAATLRLYTEGIKKDGTKSKSSKIPNKWMTLLDAPFKVSDKCCDVFKKDPFKRYEKETKRKPVMFTVVEESDQRLVSYLKTSCNSFEKGKEKSRPLSIFKESDIWDYHDKFNIKFSEVYYDRVKEVKTENGMEKRFLPAEKRTGCTFCFFGLHLEPKNKPNRIQRLGYSHPKYYDIIVNKGNLKVVFEYLNIPYKPIAPTLCNVYHKTK